LSFEKDDLRQKNVSSAIVIIPSIYIYIYNTCFVYPKKENVDAYGALIRNPKHGTRVDSLTSQS